ncbi:MAG: LacI family transcriptional regulator [Chloroflexi bacterium]|nr:MAG: LacI family transcriptional regulator [Chloroflexota bacterium]TME04169.1 MAG: LacI family transcriptional regulator [Chloroflexota bacterium]TME43186.1 MAG: LacI family transcriptional regulator [Chloroflexota bacterium]TME51607.1 MAG: LacI family transcriptional regulator [Chloroflexota bacterium]
MPEPKRPKGPLTIYDVASRAGVSIASVSRVLNSQGTPRASTRERVMRAVTELGFVPDGAARALSNGLKEVVGVVFRRGDETHFEDEDESLLFIDVINRGIDVAAQRRGFDVLMSSVGFNDQNATTRISGVAGKADGIILHDRMLPAAGVTRLAGMVPIVTLAGTPVRGAMNVRCDNEAGMRALVRHLLVDHRYQSVAYLSGRTDSPDNRARARAFELEAVAHGAEVHVGSSWQGNYSAAGGAKVIDGLLDAGEKLPRAIVCANDQTALGAMHALARRGIRVPHDVAMTGFDDVPVARHLHPPLTTVRQPMQELGATAFDVLYSKISTGKGDADVVLPVQLIIRESCGCASRAVRAAKDGI